ncbi:hypothetical protein C900_02360 [Fulvivirga imtechensis AK7]|uniref:Uncharacterized protein n=1 Tax=Fulvivirga imtechensis AK7 TaxID=1237149 RepID=L8JSG5_9BACT|nr:hypothetical protein [Fulvivirga imtechensis]ELR71775.1 hypothetical protein C900_02360 [Fulvivirga imtechensis AK7]
MTAVTPTTPLHLSFDFGVVFKALKEYVDSYNKQHPDLKEKINASHRGTAELIVRLYMKQLNDLTSVAPYSLSEMPAFRTYVSSLASCKDCTTRTIYNHKERLMKANLITAENHHGGEGLDLWINPEIMWKGAYMITYLPEGGLQRTPVYPLITKDRKIIQPLAHVLQEQDNINSNVDNKGVLTDMCGLPKGEAETGAYDKSTRKNAHDLDEKQAKEAVATALNACFLKKNEAAPAREPEKMPQPCLPERKQEQQAGGAARIFLLALVQEFWAYAKAVLYPDTDYKPYEESSILNMIYVSVYGRFNSQKTQEEWQVYQETLLERVNIVRKWLDRSPDRWIPSADFYFSPDNHKNGFDKNRIWYERQETLKLQVRNELALQKMKKELDLHNQGKGVYGQMSRYQLFVAHKRRLDKINDAGIRVAYEIAFRKSLNLKMKPHA